MINYLIDILKNLYILIETFGKIAFFANHQATIIIAGIFLIYLCLANSPRHLKLPLILSFAFLPFIYAFYHGPKPEYYFLIIIPLFVLNISQLLHTLPVKYQNTLLIIFLVNSFIISHLYYRENSGFTIKNMIQIKNQVSLLQPHTIDYDVPYGQDFAPRYFLL